MLVVRLPGHGHACPNAADKHQGAAITVSPDGNGRRPGRLLTRPRDDLVVHLDRCGHDSGRRVLRHDMATRGLAHERRPLRVPENGANLSREIFGDPGFRPPDHSRPRSQSRRIHRHSC